MRRPKLMALVGVMMVAIAGCASEETPPVATSPTVSPTVSPTTAASPQPSPGATPATTPTPAVTLNPTAPAVSGLIQPTNSQERARQVQTEIKANQRNPFAGLPPNIPVTPTTEAKPVPTVAKLPTTGAAPKPAGSPANPNGGTTTSPGNRGGSPNRTTAGGNPAVASRGSGSPGAKTTPAKPKAPVATLPPKPSTTTADGVQITGVITVGSTPQAIVVSPGGATQHVGVGQRISNGRVLVKRIENNYGAEPIVILEENGVEVAKGIG